MESDSKVRVRSLSRLAVEQERQVHALRNCCRQHEPIELPLFYSPDPEAGAAPTIFLGYLERELIGFATAPLDHFPEVIAAVHPHFRRRGVGRQLLSAALLETRRRGLSELVLVCEAAAEAGPKFARSLGGLFDGAELQLELPVSTIPRQIISEAWLPLRRAKNEDAKLLTQIGREAFGAESGLSLERIQQWLASPVDEFYVGTVDGFPVGALRVTRHPGESRASIYTFGIRRAFQRRGYGRRLLQATISKLVTQGCSTIWLEVDTTNGPAIQLYRSCGFRTVTEYQYYRIPA